MKTVYDWLEERGYVVEPAPRNNPEARLNMDYVLRGPRGRIVLRGLSRDDLESKLHVYAMRLWRRMPLDYWSGKTGRPS
jgi:hypothetical protein